MVGGGNGGSVSSEFGPELRIPGSCLEFLSFLLLLLSHSVAVLPWFV